MSYQGFPDWDKLTCDGVQKGIQDLQMTLMKISDPSVRAEYEQQIEIGKGYFLKVCNIPQLPYGLPDDINPLKGNPKNCEVEWIKELKFRENFGPSIRKTKPDETKEEFMARCQAENGIVITDPIKPIVDAIKPKTEEEEYRNFIYLAMAGIGVYLLLSE